MLSLLLATTLMFAPVTSSAVSCITCYCEDCPDVEIEVCQGGVITIVRLTYDPPGPGMIARDKTLPKSSTQSLGIGGCSFHPASPNTWGDVDECSDIHCGSN